MPTLRTRERPSVASLSASAKVGTRSAAELTPRLPRQAGQAGSSTASRGLSPSMNRLPTMPWTSGQAPVASVACPGAVWVSAVS